MAIARLTLSLESMRAVAAHTRPRSLDVWLRKRCGKPDTKQAVNRVIAWRDASVADQHVS